MLDEMLDYPFKVLTSLCSLNCVLVVPVLIFRAFLLLILLSLPHYLVL